MSLNPFEKGGAFDEKGYKTLNIIKSFGLPSIVSIVQDLNFHEMKHHDKI
jgi:hypothetical protein